KAMVIKKAKYPKAHVKFGESYAVYSYVHNYFTRRFDLVADYLALEREVVATHPGTYPQYQQVALHYNLTHYYTMQREYLKASTHGKKAIHILDQFKELHPNYMSNLYALMGSVFLKMQDPEPSIEYIKKALTYPVVDRRDSLGRAIAYTNLGYGYSMGVDLELATTYFKKALTYYNNDDLYYRAYSLNKLVEHYLDYPNIESIKNIQDSTFLYINQMIEAFKIIHPERHPSLAAPYMALSEYSEITGNFELALEHIQTSLINSLPHFSDTSIYSKPSVEECMNGYLTENTLMKKAYLLFSIAKATNDDNALLEALSIHTLLDSLLNLKKNYYSDESSIINHPNMQISYGVNLEILYLLNQRKSTETHIQQSFNYMERVKGNLLLRNLSNIEKSELFGVPDSLIAKGQKLTNNINSYLRLHPERIAVSNSEIIDTNDSLFQYLNQKDSLEDLFQRSYPQYYQVRFQTESPQIDRIKSKLNGHNLLEFYWALESIFAIYISNDDVIVHKIPIDSKLTHSIDTHIEFLKQNSKGAFLNFQKNAHELYSLLLGPIFKKKIPSKLIIVTDGPLAAIPFETLLTEKSDFKSINYRDLPYLIKQSAISYAYSTSTLFQAYEKSVLLDKPRLLAFSFSDLKNSNTGSRVLNQHSLFPLAGAAKEVESLGKLIPSSRFRSFYGNESTKNAFFNNYQNFDLIHLALHAQSDNKNRFNNRIFFHPDEDKTHDENYICFAHELYDLAPQPRLVVLSACNTGAGTNYTGEGTYSTARGFIYAGTPSVVMSLWPLSDQASKIINSDFYTQILKGAPLDEALQKAKLSFIQSTDEWTAHPSRWAALNIIGSTKPIVNTPWPYWPLTFLIISSCVLFIIFAFLKKRMTKAKSEM
ncbi:MAG: CHAT domain-containing protein, partial [Salibacteraceae bacterium]